MSDDDAANQMQDARIEELEAEFNRPENFIGFPPPGLEPPPINTMNVSPGAMAHTVRGRYQSFNPQLARYSIDCKGYPLLRLNGGTGASERVDALTSGANCIRAAMSWHGRLTDLPKEQREKMIDEHGRIDEDFMRYYVRRMADRQMQGDYAYTAGGAYGMNGWLDATFTRTVEDMPREGLIFLIASQYKEVDHWFNNGGYNIMFLPSMMPLTDLEDGREHEFVRKWVTDICLPPHLYEQDGVAVFIDAPCRHGKTTLTNAKWRACNDLKSKVLGAGTLHPLAMSNLGDDVVIHMLPYRRNCRQLYESLTGEMDKMLDGDKRLNRVLPPFAPDEIVDAASWVSAAGNFTGGGRVGLLKEALTKGVRHFICCAASFATLASQIQGLKHGIRCVSFGEFAECLAVIQQMKDAQQSITMGILYSPHVIKLGEGASEAIEQSFDLFFGPNFVYWSCISSKPSGLSLRIYEDPQTMLMDWLDVYDRNESNGCIIFTDAINVAIDIFGKIARERDWDFKYGEDPLERRENGTCAEIVLLTAAMLDQENLEEYLAKMFGMGSRSGGLYKVVMVVTTQPWIGMGVKFCQKNRVQPMSLIFNLKDKKKVMSVLQHCERCYGPDGWGLDGQHWIAWDPAITQADQHGAELVKKIDVGDVRDANVAHTMFMKEGGQYYNLSPVWAAADMHAAMDVQQKLAPNNESHYDALSCLRRLLDEADEKFRVLRWLAELARFANIQCDMEGPYVRRFFHNRGATTRLWKAIGAVCCVDFDPHTYHAVRRDEVQSDPATIDWGMDPAHVRQLVAEGTQPEDDPHTRNEYAMAVRFNDWYTVMKDVMPAQVMQAMTPKQLEVVAGQLQLAGINNPKSEWQCRAMSNLVYMYLKESEEFADTHTYFIETEKKKGCRNLGYVCKAYKAACQLLADATLCNLTNDDTPPIHPLLRTRGGLWMADVGEEKHSQLVLPGEWDMPGMAEKPFGGMMMWSEANKDPQSGRALDGREAVDVPTTVWLDRAMQQDLLLVLDDKHLGGHNLLARDYVPGQPLTLQTVMHVLDQSTAILVNRIPHKGAKKKRKGFKHTEHERKTNAKYSLFGGLEYGPPDSFNRDPQRLKDDRDMPHCIKVRALVTTAVSIASLHLDNAKVGSWLKWISVLGDQGVTDLPILSAMFEGNAQALSTIGELLRMQYPILDGHNLEKPTAHDLGWLRNMQGMNKHENVWRLMSKVPVYGQEDESLTSPVTLIHLTPETEWPRGITAGKVISTAERTMIVRFCVPGPTVDPAFDGRMVDVVVKRDMPMQTAVQTLGPLGAPGRPPRESQKDVTNDYNPFVWPKWAEPDAVPDAAAPSYDKRSKEMKRKHAAIDAEEDWTIKVVSAEGETKKVDVPLDTGTFGNVRDAIAVVVGLDAERIGRLTINGISFRDEKSLSSVGITMPGQAEIHYEVVDADSD